MKWYELVIVTVLIWAFLFVGVLYGTSKDAWNAGNSSYIPESK
jgi:hypothetical protein